jgi:cephalosporin hydroxylase
MIEPWGAGKVRDGYLPVYRRLAERIGPKAAVCELGVHQGASLRLWQELFPLGVVVGVDKDPEATWPKGTVKIIDSQDAPRLPKRLSEAVPGGFNLIVDDASHEGLLTLATMRALWPLLRHGGTYVVEDWMVGFDTWPDYNGSMLRLARHLLDVFDNPPAEPWCVESIEYRYGLIILSKA